MTGLKVNTISGEMVSQEHHKSHLIININKSRGFKKFNILKKSAQMVLKLRLPLLKQSAKNQPINSVKVICDHAGIQDMGSALLTGSTEKTYESARCIAHHHQGKHGNIVLTNNWQQKGTKTTTITYPEQDNCKSGHF
jgi:hypothetical protein